jgi:hypothetical protein
VEWRRPAVVAGRGETVSPTDRQRDGGMHGAVDACVVRGADVAAGQQCQHEVVAAAMQLSRARDASFRASLNQHLRLTSGPW